MISECRYQTRRTRYSGNSSASNQPSYPSPVFLFTRLSLTTRSVLFTVPPRLLICNSSRPTTVLATFFPVFSKSRLRCFSVSDTRRLARFQRAVFPSRFSHQPLSRSPTFFPFPPLLLPRSFCLATPSVSLTRCRESRE